MGTRRLFAAALLAFSAAVAAGVATVVPAGAGFPDPAPAPRATPSGNERTTPVVQAARSEPEPPALRPPAILVQQDGDGPSEPLVLERARYEVTVAGLASRTRATLVFRNDLDRVLEGELVYPLPDGALVSGFGLDVAGRMVDGVVVEAQHARVAFESEVRKGVDPGLVEWVRGHNFRTRVWPIPARGRRTVVVEHLAGLVVRDAAGAREAIYELPLRFPAPVEELALRIDVVRGAVAPVVRSGLANVAFERWEDRYVAETTRRGVRPGDDLRVSLPDVPREQVLVETGDGGETFFAATDFPARPPDAAAPAAPPRRIAVAWDASFSRQGADREREVRLIAAHLARLGDVEVDLIVFRNVVEPPRRFGIRGGDAAALAAHLRALPCDGATNLAALRVPGEVAYTLLFSDGLWTVGGQGDQIDGPARPMYVLNGNPRGDHTRLRALAARSGGAYYNLQRHADADVIDRLGRPVFSLLAVEADPAAVTDLEPAGAQAVEGGAVRISGRLLAPEARLTLRYGVPGQPAAEVRTIVLERGAAEPTGLVERLWAQQRMASLSIDPEVNRTALVRLGQRFSLVTPGTSLLVLETLDQYLTHDVTPPASWPELRTAFLERRRTEERVQIAKRSDHLARVVAMWERRVSWWMRDFDADPGAFRDAGLREGDGRRQVPAGAVAGRPAANAPGEPRGRSEAAARPAPRPDASMAADSAPPAGTLAAAPAPAAEEAKAGGDAVGPRIVIQPWNPDTPYLRSLERAPSGAAYRIYLAERDTYGSSPAFFLDCADHFFRTGQRDLALRILTNVAELQLEDARLLRVLAHRLEQVDELDLAVELFDHVRRLRPEEPQSHRDLALALDRRAGARARGAGDTLPAQAAADYRRALAVLAEVVDRGWDDRFPEVEVIALMEANRIASILERTGAGAPWPLDPRLRRLLDLDVRIVLTWDTDQTDMDLWVVEPGGEKCYYSHPLTSIGGALSRDFTGGYGPEEYAVRRARGGEYAVKANYYGSRSQSLTGPTTVQATIVTDFGRPGETRRAVTVRLDSAKDVVDVGAVTVDRLSSRRRSW